MRLKWAEFFKDYDLLLCPAAATAAFPHNHAGERWERMVMVNGHPQPSTTQMFWAGYSGMAYLPSTVAPAGFTPDGLPVVCRSSVHSTAISAASLSRSVWRGSSMPSWRHPGMTERLLPTRQRHCPPPRSDAFG